LTRSHADVALKSSAPANPQGFRSSLMPLFLLAGIFFLNFLSRIILAPFLMAVERDLRLSHGEAGSLFLFISIGYCISLLLSGFLSARIGHRRTIIISALTLGLALVAIAVSHSLAAVRSGLVFLGLATGLYLPSGIATITDLVVPHHWGKAVAIHELAPNLGFVLAPVVAQTLPAAWSWRGVLVLLGVVSLMMGGVFVRFGSGGVSFGESPSPKILRQLAGLPGLWIMTVFFSLAIGSSMGLYTMIPLYLVTERGMEQSWSNTVVSVSRVGAMAVAVAGGWFADRLGRKTAMGIFLAATGIATTWLGLVSDRWLSLSVCLQPMLAVCFFPAGFAVLSHIVPARMRSVSISLVIPVGILIGAGLIPTGLGLLGEHQAFHIGFAAIGALILASVALLTVLRLPEG
jgi:NNP family nitrate/nitrite transporter-like MFS transporter